jgi:hypothetical protein
MSSLKFNNNASVNHLDICGRERVIVSGTSSMLWTCSPSEYVCNSMRVSLNILDLRVARKL